MAKQSLFGAKREEPATAALPAIPSGSGFGAVDTPDESTGGAYVVFARKDKLAELRSEVPGLQDGDAVLLGDGSPRKLAPLTMMLLDVYQFWCVKGGESENYAPIKTKETRPEESEDDRGRRWDEVVSAHVLVIEDKRITPATIRASGGMARGIYDGVRATREAASEEWAKRSPAHAATLRIPQPNMRFVVTMSWRAKKSKGGYTYYTSSGKITPVDAALAELLKSHMANEEFPEDIETTRINFEKYRDEMRELAV